MHEKDRSGRRSGTWLMKDVGLDLFETSVSKWVEELTEQPPLEELGCPRGSQSCVSPVQRLFLHLGTRVIVKELTECYQQENRLAYPALPLLYLWLVAA
jgi:hypothetical protein